jgi:hypothetical protein
LGKILPPGIRLRERAAAGQRRERRPGFKSPVRLDRRSRPDVERAVVFEEIAIAKADPRGKATAGRDGAELRIESLPIGEDRVFFDDTEPAMKGVLLLGLESLLLFLALLAQHGGARVGRLSDRRRCECQDHQNGGAGLETTHD